MMVDPYNSIDVSDDKHIRNFVQNILQGDNIFVGGIDRSGTTKIGQIFHQKTSLMLPELFLLVEPIILNGGTVDKKSMKNIFQVFVETYQGRSLNLNPKNISNFLGSNQDITLIEVLNFIKHEIYGKSSATGFVETSPRNLTNSLLIRGVDTNSHFIFTYRDPFDVWMSHVNVGWGPSSINLFINNILDSSMLLSYWSKVKKNVLVLNYNQIGILENIVNECKEGVDKDQQSAIKILLKKSNYTVRQHSNIDKNFKLKKYKEDALSRYLFKRLALRNYRMSSFYGCRSGMYWRMIDYIFSIYLVTRRVFRK
jgi:hypothetical protein